MSSFNRPRTLHLVAQAAVLLLGTSFVLADGDDGLPSPPNVTSGTVGTIQTVTIMGRTFQSGKQVVTTADADSVTVNLESWAPDGGGSRPNIQRHLTIQYRWTMKSLPPDPNVLRRFQEAELTETITVKSTLQNLDTGKTTTERDDSYNVQTTWEKVGKSPFILSASRGTSSWKSDGGSSGTFMKVVFYRNEPAADKQSFASHRVFFVTTNYNEVDPMWGGWSFDRQTSWNFHTGALEKHTVSINGANPPNPFGCAMMERAAVGRGMDPEVNDPAIPPLLGIPFEWPSMPGFV